MLVPVTVYIDNYGLKVSKYQRSNLPSHRQKEQPEVFSLSNPVLIMKIVLNKDFVYGL